MKRSQAFAIVRQRGGTPRRGVTNATTLLVVGQLGWPLMDDGRPSNSLKRAKSLQLPIVNEPSFLELAGLRPNVDDMPAYSINKLMALTSLSEDEIERLVDIGLLRPTDNLFRFRDIAAARTLVRLSRSGVKLSKIVKSLAQIRKWLPEADLPNVKLVLEGEALELRRFDGRVNPRGQFLLPLDMSTEDADALVEEAQVAAEQKRWEDAERCYRRAISADHNDPVILFDLADLIRGQGRHTEAEKLYRSAVRLDPHFAEGWYNLSDLLDSREAVDEAIECLERSIEADPEYADAHFNLGLLLQKRGQFEKATRCWRRYLDLDENSEWSKKARRALKYCETMAQATN
jgi:tetratricopeptide (TPR) repeat protein